jgi:hypothetical protein
MALQISLLIALLTLAVGLSLSRPGEADRVWNASQVSLTNLDQAEFASPALNDSQWDQLNLSEVSNFSAVGWIRTSLSLDLNQSSIPPYALFVSGPFSAEVFWDGQLLGNKGTVGANTSLESAGPIDSVLYIPEALSTPGVHQLALRISNTQLGYQAESLIHRLEIGGFQSDPRRQLRFYALPLILSGGFLLLALQFSRVYLGTGNLETMALAAMSFFILLQLGFEVSRSLVSYGYGWHLFRSQGIWFFAGLSALSLNVFVILRNPKPWFSKLLWLIVLVVFISSWLVDGFDGKTKYAIYLLTIIPLLSNALALRARQADLVLMSSGFLCLSWLIIGELQMSALLDSGYYLSSIGFLALVSFWVSKGSGSMPTVKPKPSTPTHFMVKQSRRVEKIPGNEVCYLKATGNYAELVCTDGRVVLHHLRLGQVMEHIPDGFIRVHRSFAVNTKYIVALRSQEGSRYQVELEGGEKVPVSRYQVKELRAQLLPVAGI